MDGDGSDVRRHGLIMGLIDCVGSYMGSWVEAMDERVMGTRGGVRKGWHHGSHEGSDRDGGMGECMGMV